jgi:hypothetical protein
MMINKVLTTLQREIQDYLKRSFQTGTEDIIVLSSIVSSKGDIAIPEDKLGLSLVHIEEERVFRAQTAFTVAPDRTISHMNPEIKLNLYVLVSANCLTRNTYGSGLKYLSAVIEFFQGKNVFDARNTPLLDPLIEKLIVELQSLDFEQQNHLWATLGAKYLPSVLYKVRMVVIQEAQKTDEQPPITSIRLSERML